MQNIGQYEPREVRAELDGHLILFYSHRLDLTGKKVAETTRFLRKFCLTFAGIKFVPLHNVTTFAWVLDVDNPRLAKTYFLMLTGADG